MTVEVLEALTIILKTCLEQNNCEECPLAKFCQKMPSEW